MENKDDFIRGVVVALDVVAIYDYGVCFKEIVESVGKETVLKEIKKNGLHRTKEMAKSEFRKK
jgi:hypothetical protein